MSATRSPSSSTGTGTTVPEVEPKTWRSTVWLGSSITTTSPGPTSSRARMSSAWVAPLVTRMLSGEASRARLCRTSVAICARSAAEPSAKPVPERGDVRPRVRLVHGLPPARHREVGQRRGPVPEVQRRTGLLHRRRFPRLPQRVPAVGGERRLRRERRPGRAGRGALPGGPLRHPGPRSPAGRQQAVGGEQFVRPEDHRARHPELRGQLPRGRRTASPARSRPDLTSPAIPSHTCCCKGVALPRSSTISSSDDPTPLPPAPFSRSVACTTPRGAARPLGPPDPRAVPDLPMRRRGGIRTSAGHRSALRRATEGGTRCCRA